MKVQTFTVIAGTKVCNARCPYCISKMTPCQGVGVKEEKINWRNFEKACKFAEVSNISTVLITGKGEPTLYPRQITDFLKKMKKHNFPFIEIQTNGISLEEEKYNKYLKEWYDLGLTTICLSIVHYEKEKNKEIYTPYREYIKLKKLIDKLHEIGFSVRLSCTMIKDFIDSPEKAEELIKKVKEWKVEQLTLREVAKPQNSENKDVHQWTSLNTPTRKQYDKIKELIKSRGNKIMTLGHGAVVYDFEGQNVCLTDALTIKPESDNIRQLIFFPDGHLRYDWQFKGAILI